MLKGDGSSVMETVFVPTLAEFDGGFDGAGIIGGLPVLDIASCFANWLFQKSSFFIWEVGGVLHFFGFKASERFRLRTYAQVTMFPGLSQSNHTL